MAASTYPAVDALRFQCCNAGFEILECGHLPKDAADQALPVSMALMTSASLRVSCTPISRQLPPTLWPDVRRIPAIVHESETPTEIAAPK